MVVVVGGAASFLGSRRHMAGASGRNGGGGVGGSCRRTILQAQERRTVFFGILLGSGGTGLYGVSKIVRDVDRGAGKCVCRYTMKAYTPDRFSITRSRK